MTYDNPVYLEQKNRKHEEVDNSGFVIPKQLTEEEMIEDETLDSNIEEITDDVDDDWDDWEEEEIEEVKEIPKIENPKKEILFKPKVENQPQNTNTEILNNPNTTNNPTTNKKVIKFKL